MSTNDSADAMAYAISGTRKAIKEMADGTLRIQIDIEPRDKAQFHSLFPEIDMPVAVAPLVPVAEGLITEGTQGPDINNFAEYKAKYGQQAKKLRLSSFFRRPEVWRAIGTAEEFHTWTQNQKCIVCGKMDYINNDSEIGGGYKCEGAHVRRAGESGTGYKADYSVVPMCRVDHSLQHEHGESAVYQAAAQPEGSNAAETLQLAKDWFNKQLIINLQKWCWETLKTDLGYNSWSDVPPWELLKWAQDHNVSCAGRHEGGSLWLPRCYYDTYREDPNYQKSLNER